MLEERLQEVGKIKHFYSKIGVAIANITAPVEVGDEIRIKGSTTDFKQIIKSMEVEHKKIEKARSGDAIGLKVENRVREGDIIYKVL